MRARLPHKTIHILTCANMLVCKIWFLICKQVSYSRLILCTKLFTCTPPNNCVQILWAQYHEPCMVYISLLLFFSFLSASCLPQPYLLSTISQASIMCCKIFSEICIQYFSQSHLPNRCEPNNRTWGQHAQAAKGIQNAQNKLEQSIKYQLHFREGGPVVKHVFLSASMWIRVCVCVLLCYTNGGVLLRSNVSYTNTQIALSSAHEGEHACVVATAAAARSKHLSCDNAIKRPRCDSLRCVLVINTKQKAFGIIWQ